MQKSRQGSTIEEMRREEDNSEIDLYFLHFVPSPLKAKLRKGCTDDTAEMRHRSGSGWEDWATFSYLHFTLSLVHQRNERSLGNEKPTSVEKWWHSSLVCFESLSSLSPSLFPPFFISFPSPATLFLISFSSRHSHFTSLLRALCVIVMDDVYQNSCSQETDCR